MSFLGLVADSVMNDVLKRTENKCFLSMSLSSQRQKQMVMRSASMIGARINFNELHRICGI